MANFRKPEILKERMSNMGPLIGITAAYENDAGRFFLREAYVKAIERAGGIPIILPCAQGDNLRSLVDKMDGFLFSGGSDVDPFFFGEEPLPGNGEITPERDVFELGLAMEVLRSNKPVLAICRGAQVINIAAGGTIYQDIATQVDKPLKHSQEAPRWHPTHFMEVVQGTRLADMLQVRSVRVNSMHHQAVAGVAPGFVVSAWASDGVIEAIESTGPGYVVGVQCHPEYLWEQNEGFANLFKSFVQEANKK